MTPVILRRRTLPVRIAVAAARETFGGLDVVVANAGLGFGGAVADVDDEQWQRTLDVNLTGAFRLTRAALPSLIERGGGSIVLVSSTAALVSGAGNAPYEASKAALLGLARSIAVALGPRGIRANALCPDGSRRRRATSRCGRSWPSAASRSTWPTES
jgi:meso-butanediol dehydrogenase / (S,S)-butanediol dehydrogenase / diacetyl reductase